MGSDRERDGGESSGDGGARVERAEARAAMLK